jgi:hypothetical protein
VLESGIEYIYLILYSLLVLGLSLHDIRCWILLNFVILGNDHISFRVAWRSRTFRILTFTFPLFRIFFFFILLRLIVVIQTSILNLLWINFRHNELLKLFLWISLLILIHSEILILHEIVDLNIKVHSAVPSSYEESRTCESFESRQGRPESSRGWSETGTPGHIAHAFTGKGETPPHNHLPSQPAKGMVGFRLPPSLSELRRTSRRCAWGADFTARRISPTTRVPRIPLRCIRGYDLDAPPVFKTSIFSLAGWPCGLASPIEGR